MNETATRTPSPAGWAAARNLRLAARLDAIALDSNPGRGLIREGVLRRAVGLTLEAVGCEAPMGATCKVEVADGWVDAEVVGFASDRTYLMPSAELHGLLPNARVVPSYRRGGVEVGEGLLGRVIDSDGVPLDGKGPIRAEGTAGMAGVAINPLAREPITQPLDVGVRAINALLPIGRGQRVGLFAGSGVGKSTLLGMMTRFTSADVIVVGLIGERGREVRDFVETTLGEEGLRRAVVVAAPADRPPLARLHGAYRATAIAEWFRDQGLNVLLLMDSLTRFAQAQREIGLSVGEPPTTRGYPPNCRRWSNAPATVPRAAARSPPSIPCSPKATTRRTPSPMPPVPSSTATSCSRGGWPIRACTRPSTSNPRSAAWCRTSPTTPGGRASANSSGWWRRILPTATSSPSAPTSAATTRPPTKRWSVGRRSSTSSARMSPWPPTFPTVLRH